MNATLNMTPGPWYYAVKAACAPEGHNHIDIGLCQAERYGSSVSCTGWRDGRYFSLSGIGTPDDAKVVSELPNLVAALQSIAAGSCSAIDIARHALSRAGLVKPDAVPTSMFDRAAHCGKCTGDAAAEYPFSECSACDRYPHQEAVKVGEEEGDKCNRAGCTGTIVIGGYDDGSCCCHISPPCAHCMSGHLVCDTCDWDSQD